MLTDKQKTEREASLGSSDAPVVCGVSRRSSPLELFYKLHGDLPRYDDLETMQQRIGSRLEPVIAELVAEELNIKIRRIPSRTHPKYPFITAHADFEIVSNPKGPGLMEVKNRSGEKPWESVPDDVLIQCVHQMAVTNREYTVVGGLFQFGQIKPYEIERDKELEEYLIEIESRFMLRVQKGEPPDHTWTPEKVGMLKKLYPMDSGKTVALPIHALTCEAFVKAKAAIKAAETEEALYGGMLREAMKEASIAIIPGYKVTWKNDRPGRKFDQEQFAKDQPALYEQYQKTVPGARKLLVKPAKELAS